MNSFLDSRRLRPAARSRSRFSTLKTSLADAAALTPATGRSARRSCRARSANFETNSSRSGRALRKLRSSVVVRSEERRVGKECRSGWSAYHEKKKYDEKLEVIS